MRQILIVVVGSTGSGKTKLSIELGEAIKAQQFCECEIVSCDSMQIYKNIDILSAKATPLERKRIKHHMIDIVDIDDNQFSVERFSSLTTELINHWFKPELFANSPTLPIIVGGTNFYLESLLFSFNFQANDKTIKLPEDIQNFLENSDNQELYDKLKEVDPGRAELLHPNIRRKLVRSLEIFYKTGKKHSDWIEEQTHSLAFSQPICILWVKSSQNALEERLRKRVDDMVEQGLKEELKTIARVWNGKKMDFEVGALQSIGIKEFKAWLENYQLKDGEDDESLFTQGLEAVKSRTIQYAIHQIKWIENRLANRIPIYVLDSSDVTQWYQNVLDPSIKIVTRLLNGKEHESIMEMIGTQITNVTFLKPPDPSTNEKTIWKKHNCIICSKILNGDQEWNAHLKSKGHKAARKRSSRLIQLSQSSSSSSISTFQEQTSIHIVSKDNNAGSSQEDDKEM